MTEFKPTPAQVAALANLLPLGYDYPRDPYPDVIAAAKGVFASDEAQEFIRTLQPEPAPSAGPTHHDDLVHQMSLDREILTTNLQMIQDGDYRDQRDKDLRTDALIGISALNALTAVLKVHAPIEDTIHHDWLVCSHRHCMDDAMDQNIWPCPTYRAASSGWGEVNRA